MLHQIFNIFYTSSPLIFYAIINFIMAYFTTVNGTRFNEEQEEAEVASLLQNPEDLSSDSEERAESQENVTDSKDVIDHGEGSQNILYSITHFLQDSDAEDEFDQYMNSLPDVSLPKPIIPLIIQPTSSSRFRRKPSKLYREALLNKGIKWIEREREMGKDVSYWDMIL